MAFFQNFQNLKDNYNYKTTSYYISLNNKFHLYRFIVHLKTYYRLVVECNKEFTDKGTLKDIDYQKNIPVIYYRESKKYFPKLKNLKYYFCQIINNPKFIFNGNFQNLKLNLYYQIECIYIIYL